MSAAVRRLGAEGLAQPCEFAGEPLSTLILRINREAIHHGVEIALLRDLYLARSGGGLIRLRRPFPGILDIHAGGNMAGKFVLKKGTSGKYRFNLPAGNGQVIATSKAYERKQSALNGIESVKENAPGAGVDDQSGD